MSQDALMSLFQSIRNQAIALVQQSEAAIALIDPTPRQAGPTCGNCGASGLILAKNVAICRQCNHNQPA